MVDSEKLSQKFFIKKKRYKNNKVFEQYCQESHALSINRQWSNYDKYFI